MHLGALLLLLLSCSIAITADESTSTCESSLSSTSKTILSLSSQLIKRIGGEGNFLISPLSISTALAMLYVGTKGTTKTQMTNALGYQLVSDTCMDIKVSEAFRDLIVALESKSDAYSLLVASSVFIHSSFPVSPDYVARLRDFFRSDVKYFDFARDETLSMKAINNWVSNQTRGQIPKLLNEPLDPMTVMVLMNVVYFKGLWEHPFPKHNTWDSLFRKNDTTKIIPFMMQEDNILGFYYDPTINYSFLELNYIGEKVSMLLALPKNDKEFPNFDLTSESLCNIRRNLQPTNVMVILPKFKMEYRRELSQDMMKLGIGEIFSDKADLSGIRPQKDIHVSLMMHKAVIEVDEMGSEASAVSGVGIVSRKKPSDRMMFWADHPFLFYIIDKDTNAVLFTGRVVDP
ncbi:hypothetical protein JTE90_028254 [Oedothorax gibbosus]|uniref:Serpin domain-containing protein n=1 Tax=Oedothorax gibbosus TaxID=931172 RepID=A0AAV6UT89_9ARAC|nr:hypothetical protein JTE90_028254 [Oedothorax gibbosus]